MAEAHWSHDGLWLIDPSGGVHPSALMLRTPSGKGRACICATSQEAVDKVWAEMWFKREGQTHYDHWVMLMIRTAECGFVD